MPHVEKLPHCNVSVFHDLAGIAFDDDIAVDGQAVPNGYQGFSYSSVHFSRCENYNISCTSKPWMACTLGTGMMTLPAGNAFDLFSFTLYNTK